MSKQAGRVVVYPGTFDPPTNGHLDVIRRGVELFDELIVGVGKNPEKSSLLSRSERVALLREIVADLPGVRVEAYDGLTVDFAKAVGASAILRGLRSPADLHFELQIAMTNRAIADVETVFVPTAPANAFTSSSLVRQIAEMGGDVSALVPPQVPPHVKANATSGEASDGRGTA
jgi:pantetheine-phosphate adenylyltransferase